MNYNFLNRTISEEDSEKKNVSDKHQHGTSQACGISCPVITKRIKACPISGSEGQSSAHFKKSENLHSKGAGPSSFCESIYPPRCAANTPCTI